MLFPCLKCLNFQCQIPELESSEYFVHQKLGPECDKKVRVLTDRINPWFEGLQSNQLQQFLCISELRNNCLWIFYVSCHTVICVDPLKRCYYYQKV